MSEESEIVKVAIEGTNIYLRLAGTSIKDALKFLKFIFSGVGDIANWATGIEDRRLDRELKQLEVDLKTHKKETMKMEMDMIKARTNLAAGSMDIKEFMKIFAAEERTILQVPDASMERFSQLAEKNGLTYSMLQDLNYSDGYVQVLVPNSQADIWKALEEQLQKEEMEKNKINKENLQKDIDDTVKEKAEYTAEKKKMEREGTDKTDPEHYNDVISSIKLMENKEKSLKERLDKLEGNITGEITLEDYMNTNPQAFDHTDLFHEMSENGIVPKGCEKVSEFLKVPDGSISRYKEGIKGEQGNSINPDGYIVNPDIPDLAIQREEISKDNKVTGYQYTILEEGKADNKIQFKTNAKTTDEEKTMFIRQINQMAKKKNPDYSPGDKWMVIGSTEELEKYREIAKKNEALQKTDKELKEEFKEIMGKEQSEKIIDLAKTKVDDEKNIIEIPEDRLMVKRQEGKKPEFYIRSENNMYVIHLDPNKIKQDKSGKKILILGKDEHVDIIERATRKPSGKEVRSQKDLSDFLSGQNTTAKENTAIRSQEKGGRKK
ncbi:MAG: hypothetical protein K2M78_08105 [Lachnospiraceae bacterium]|nr:hypothetical protein [Lachnospiraceae bacterium]